jgi:phosphoglycerate dehydrogenase-like enzyme
MSLTEPPRRVLVTGHPYGDGVTEILHADGVGVIRGDPPSHPGIEPVFSGSPSQLEKVEVIVVSHMDSCPAELISMTPRLRGIVSAVIGLDTVDLAAAEERDLLVAHGAMEENYLGVSEATVMLIAALLLDLPGKERALREMSSEARMRGRMVRGKRIGLVGLGRSARGVVERLQGWEVDIVAHDPYVVDPPAGVWMVSLHELLATSDVVSVHVTLGEATRGLIGENELELMKEDGYLINTARGPVVDEAALLEALETGRIAGAALDVFEEEPLSKDHPFRGLSNVILTPHAIGHSFELWEAIPRVAAEQVTAILAGEVPRYVANNHVLPRWRGRVSTP